jgi:hypothetical protein
MSGALQWSAAVMTINVHEIILDGKSCDDTEDFSKPFHLKNIRIL